MSFLRSIKIKIKAVSCAQLFAYLLAIALNGCGGGGGGSSHTNSNPNTPGVPTTVAIAAPALPANNQFQLQCPTVSIFSVTAPPPITTSAISGRITFERVPFAQQHGDGLDYVNQQTLPARGVVVEALASSDGVQCSGSVVATAVTDGDGWYQLTPAGSANICVRARAQLYRVSDGSSAANWNFAVADNTASNVLYVMTEASAVSINDRPRRDLHAASGWTNGSYNTARVAAPFAILDTVCKAMDAVLATRAATQFGALTYFWSTKNTSDKNGTLQQGKIGSSFFNPNTVSIYLRGDAEVNTDEFDEMVIAHEFGHFVTHTLSRSDSIGGSHSLLDYEDPRLAFDEGWATAFAALALHDPIYRDSDEVSTPNSPSREFYFDIRQRFSNANIPTGWFSESSMQRALYALGSDTDDGGTGMGLGALLQTFSGNYRQTEALASIFSYGETLKSEQNTFASAIAAVLDMEQINGDSITEFADTETNTPSQLDLPVYRLLNTVGSKQQVCSSDAYGTQNTLSSRRYVRFIPPQTARYRFTIQPVNATSNGGVAGFELLDRGHSIAYQEGSTAGATLTALSGSALQSGRSYVLGIFHTGNVIEHANVAAGDQCFWVSAVTAP
jgi:hypothetical protein